MSSSGTSAPHKNSEDERECREHRGPFPYWVNFRNAILILALTFQILSFLKHGRVVFLGSEGGAVSSIGSSLGASGRGSGHGAVEAASASAGAQPAEFAQATAFTAPNGRQEPRGLAAIRSASATGSGPGGSSRDPSAAPPAAPLGASAGAPTAPASQAAEPRRPDPVQPTPSAGGGERPGASETPEADRGDSGSATPDPIGGGPTAGAESGGEPQAAGDPEAEVASTSELTTVASTEGDPGAGKAAEPSEAPAGDSLSA